MKSRFLAIVVLAVFLGLCAGVAHAQPVDTVDWAPDAVLDGTGTGTLTGGTITVIYSTIPGAGNAGITIPDDWNVAFATDGATGSGVTYQTGGVFGTLTGSFVQEVAFSANVTDPILFVNFSDETTQMDFGSLSLTFLDSFNAQLAGSTVNFVGSTNSFHDGFAARINGTFGPGSPIQFTYFSEGSVTDFDSVGFTVATSVPEPGSVALLAGALTVGGLALRRRKK